MLSISPIDEAPLEAFSRVANLAQLRELSDLEFRGLLRVAEISARKWIGFCDEGLAQDIAVGVWNRLTHNDWFDLSKTGAPNILPIAYNLARQECVSHVRRTYRSAPISIEEPMMLHLTAPDDTLGEIIGKEDIVEQERQAEALNLAIQALPDWRDRLIAEAKREGKPYDEVADQVGLSYAAVKMRATRVVAELRELLKERRVG